MEEHHQEGGQEVSLAKLVLQTVERLQQLTGSGSTNPLLKQHSIREITFSLAYDPGVKGEPLPLPPGTDGPPVMAWAEARAYLLAHDRPVFVDADALQRAPLSRVARLNLTIRLM